MFSKFIRLVTFIRTYMSFIFKILVTHDFAQCPLTPCSFGFCSKSASKSASNQPQRYIGLCYKWRIDYCYLVITKSVEPHWQSVSQPNIHPFPLLTMFLASLRSRSPPAQRFRFSTRPPFPTMLMHPFFRLLSRSRLFLRGMLYCCYVCALFWVHHLAATMLSKLLTTST